MNPPTTPYDFLFANWEGGGHIPPLLSIWRRLTSRGHRVRVMSDDCNRKEVEAVGAEFVSYKSAPSRKDKSPSTDLLKDWEVATPPEKIGRLVERVMCGKALEYGNDIAGEMERRRPDLVVSTDLLLGPMIAAEARHQAFAVLAVNICLYGLPGLPPFGPGFMPAQNEQERQRDREVAEFSKNLFNQGLPALNAARRAFGLAPLNDVSEQVGKAARYWLATSQHFDFPAERLPENMRYVGPELDDQYYKEPWTSPWPAEDRRPLVLVAFSTTFQDQGGTLQRVIDGLGKLPVRGLVTLGPAFDGKGLTPTENVVVCRSAPHNEVMKQASVVISHCGHGTVMKTLAAGLPMLCMPMGRDQNDNAARVVYRGAGSMLQLDASSDAIAKSVKELIEVPSFKANAQRLGALVKKDSENSTVVAEMEALAERSRR